MKRSLFILFCLCVFSTSVLATSLKMEATKTLPESYVVKKGDTLWDIAVYFFDDPSYWTRLWAKNPEILNPDLIYPGNVIDLKRLLALSKHKSLSVEHMTPELRERAVERMSNVVVKASKDQAISKGGLKSISQVIGYIIGHEDERRYYALHDKLFVHLNISVVIGDMFNIYREADSMQGLDGKTSLYLPSRYLGQIQVLAKKKDMYQVRVIASSEEMIRGDMIRR